MCGQSDSYDGSDHFDLQVDHFAAAGAFNLCSPRAFDTTKAQSQAQTPSTRPVMTPKRIPDVVRKANPAIADNANVVMKPILLCHRGQGSLTPRDAPQPDAASEVTVSLATSYVKEDCESLNATICCGSLDGSSDAVLDPEFHGALDMANEALNIPMSIQTARIDRQVSKTWNRAAWDYPLSRIDEQERLLELFTMEQASNADDINKVETKSSQAIQDLKKHIKSLRLENRQLAAEASASSRVTSGSHRRSVPPLALHRLSM
jgi:hypothetical protein